MRIIAALLALGLAPAATAQDAVGTEIRDRLRAALAENAVWHRENGHDLEVVGATIAALPPGKAQPIRLPTEAGQSYLILAVCEASCRDLDLGFIDPFGKSVAADRAVDPFPVLTVNVTDQGDHAAMVIMSDCLAETCAFGLLLSRRVPLE